MIRSMFHHCSPIVRGFAARVALSVGVSLFCLVGLTTDAHAAPGDITAVRIAGNATHNGWTAEIDIASTGTGGTYDLGLGSNNDPSTAKIVFTLTSPGYDASGNATTLTRTVYGTKFVRKPYPDSTTSSSVADESSSGGTLTVKVALSEFIYSGDTSITATIASGFYTKTGVPNNAATAMAVTNSSTLTYPKTIGHFVVEQRRPVNGTQTVEVIAVQKFAQNGKPVAAVRITATGATSGHVETGIATVMTLSARGDNIPVYAVDLNLSTAAGFTRGELVNIGFTAYPWVGTGSAVLDATRDAGTHAWELGPLKWTIMDKMIAVVASSGGDDTTCVASTVQATADAGTPCATINGALTKIAAANNTSFSLNRIDGGEVQVKAGTWQTGKYSTQTNTNGYFTIAPHSSTNQTGVVFDSSYLNNQNQYTYQRYYNVTFNRSSNVYIVNGGTNTVLIMEKVNFADAQGAWYAGGSVGATTNLEVLDSTTSNAYFTTGGNSQHSRLNRNNTYTNPTGAAGSIVGDAQCVIGLKGTGSVKPIWTVLTSLNENNILIGYTKWLSQSDNFFILGYSTGVTVTNMAIINNLVERIGSSSTPISEISVGNHSNVLLWHNTYAGQRFNHENDITNHVDYTFTNWSGKFNSFDSRGDHRADLRYPGDETLVGTWSVGYSVGWEGNHNEAIAFAGDTDFWGLRSNTPANGSTGFASTYPAGYASNKSRAGTNVGNGDYHLLSSSLSLNKVASGFSALPYDLDGNPRRNDGTGAAGAYESDVTAPTITNVTSDKTNETYAIGEVIDIDVTFSEVVTSTGNVTVTVETGTTDRTYTFTVTGSTTGTCNYTVQAGDTSADLTVNSIAGTITDAVGNAMTNFVPSTNLAANKALVIDTIAPSAPGTPDLGAASDSGTSSTDNITSDTTPTITVSCESAATVSLLSGATVLGSGTCASSTVSITSSAFSPNGVYFLKARQTDGVGNVSSDSSTLSVTIDTAAPTLGEVTPVATPTNDNTPNYVFSSTEAGTISYGGDCSSGTTSASSGNNTVTFSALSDGTYNNCTVLVTDAAGNASSALGVSAFTVDTVVASSSSSSSMSSSSTSSTTANGGGGGGRRGDSTPGARITPPQASDSADTPGRISDESSTKGHTLLTNMRERLAWRIEKRIQRYPALAFFLRRVLERLDARIAARVR